MRYQLVVQFRGDWLDNLDAIVALEDRLSEQLADIAEVDGHDIGSGQANLFVLTSDPIATFAAAKAVLDRASLLTAATVAYRPTDGEDYTVVWPTRFDEVFRVA